MFGQAIKNKMAQAMGNTPALPMPPTAGGADPTGQPDLPGMMAQMMAKLDTILQLMQQDSKKDQSEQAMSQGMPVPPPTQVGQ